MIVLETIADLRAPEGKTTESKALVQPIQLNLNAERYLLTILIGYSPHQASIFFLQSQLTKQYSRRKAVSSFVSESSIMARSNKLGKYKRFNTASMKKLARARGFVVGRENRTTLASQLLEDDYDK